MVFFSLSLINRDWPRCFNCLTASQSLSATMGAQLLVLTIEHPQQEKLQRDFKILGIEANTVKGSNAALIAKIEGRTGVVELR